MPRKKKPLEDLSGLRKMAESAPSERREAAISLLLEIEFLQGTLKDLKEKVNVVGAVIQTARTVKENPALRAYNTSIMRYSQLLKQLVDMLPEPQKAQDGSPLIDFIKQ